MTVMKTKTRIIAALTALLLVCAALASCGSLEKKLVGTWKVYGDAENAEKLFKKYRMCTKLYSEQWAKGKSIEELSVRI